MRVGFLAPLVSHPTQTFSLRNATTGAIVAHLVEAALDSETRRRGLLGRDGLPDGTALVIAPSNAVHTFFMRFAIDIMFVRRDGRVTKVRTGVPARRVLVSPRAFGVVEMAAGAIVGVTPGDYLELATTSPAKAELSSADTVTYGNLEDAVPMRPGVRALELGSYRQRVHPGLAARPLRMS